VPPNRVVVVVLKGGLGNQLFQYAAGTTAAQQLNAVLTVDGTGAGAALLDNALGIEVVQATPETLRRLAIGAPGHSTTRVMQRIHRRTLHATGKVRYERQNHRDAHAPMPELEPRGNIVGLHLDGYFQHPTWFSASLTGIAARLGNRLKKVASHELGRGATVISFRRGDYVPLGWDLPLGYYERALQMVPPTDGPVWVVGDDQMVIELIRDWLDGRGWTTSAPPDLGADPLVRDMALLGAAERVVMSNSTYCWWGVNAGDPDSTRSERTIITPASWLPLSGSATLVRPHWNAIA
jgi:hypothetical protein